MFGKRNKQDEDFVRKTNDATGVPESWIRDRLQSGNYDPSRHTWRDVDRDYDRYQRSGGRDDQGRRR